MPPPARILRSVKDIRTRSGAPDQTMVPYKAYMVITALEMEKYRRQIERRSLVTRLKNVTARLRFIETERTAILDRLGKSPAPRAVAPAALRPGTRPMSCFKMKY